MKSPRWRRKPSAETSLQRADDWAWVPAKESGLIVPTRTLPAPVVEPTPVVADVERQPRKRRTWAKRAPWHRNAALIVPLLLVNTAAIYGQTGWAYDHLSHDPVIAGLFATAVESIGVYLAAEAHAALMAGDASARLRLGSYLVGMLVGTLNFEHFAGVGWEPTPLAVTFGLLSSVSPLLWAIRSRSKNRERLRELGQVDPRAVRFSLLRWALFPVRTASAFRAAVWAGVIQPSEAVAAADAARFARRADRIVRKAERKSEPTPAPAAEIAVISEPTKPPVDVRAEAPKPTQTRPTKSARTAQKVTQAARKNPDATPTAIAAKVGVSTDTARRYLRRSKTPVVAAEPSTEPAIVPA